MIKLYQFSPFWSLPNASPFCMKMETYLRMAKIPFEIVYVNDPRKSPKRKLPHISDDGKIIADTDFIIDYLQQKYGDKLDNHLTDEQKMYALTIRRMLEEHLYWVIVYSRWIDNRNWPNTEKAFFGDLQKPIRYIIPKLIKRNINRTLYAQGIGRHSMAEIYQLGIKDLSALSTLLEKNKFGMGKKASSIDACIYAFLANIVYPPIPSPLQDYAKSQAHFLSYCEDMKAMFFSETTIEAHNG